ncbi:MAG: hypothetical protein WC156_14660, partial [Pedobacter sp.]
LSCEDCVIWPMLHQPGEWRAFYARFIKLITRHHGNKDDAGKFAARLLREATATSAKRGIAGQSGCFH